MTPPIPAGRLAELRCIATCEDWSPPQPEDLAALIGEIDRLTAENEQLADFDALGQRGAALQAGRDQAVQRWHDEHGRAEAAEGERDRLWMLLEIERGLTSSVRLHVNQLLGVLGPQRPQDIPQPQAHAPAVRPAMDFPSGVANDAHEGAVGFEPTPDGRLYVNGPPCRHDRTLLVQTETGWVCMVCGPARAAESIPVLIRRRTRAERVAYLADHRDDAIARGLPAELIDDMIADAEREIAPEDEGIASADVRAQIAADTRTAVAPLSWHYGPTETDPNPGSMWCYACAAEVWSFKDGSIACTGCGAADPPDAATTPVHPKEPPPGLLRTPQQWCTHYGVGIIDPDGWRSHTDPRDWSEPITLAEFERRSRTSTADFGNDAWSRLTRDALAGSGH